jgi:hypothetical protein
VKRTGVLVLAGLVLVSAVSSAGAQNRPYSGPRTADGKPDLDGIWQAMTTADWDLLAHAAQPGRVVALGAEDAEPPGIGVVEGNDIPYLPGALTQKKANFEHRLTDDPELKCYMPGVPRATYLPVPFQIVQSPKTMLFAYEFGHAARTIYMQNPPPSAVDAWMGHSVGHWEGDALVIDVTGFNDRTWFDRVGDYHSDALHVVERYTAVREGLIQYEATVEDKNVFSRPWKISLFLYRHEEKNAQLLEFKCGEFTEELLYGPYRRKD